MKSIAAYIRVSSDKQDTLRQEKRILATEETISLWFRDEVGKNPRDLPEKREAFQQMLKAVQAGLICKIIVDRQDRFGVKNAHQWGKFISLLQDHDCELFDADGKNLSADDEVSILTGALGAITSTREQKEKAHRNVTSKVEKAKLGEYQGGYPPYGFDVVCFGTNKKEKWRTVYVGKFKRLKVYPNGKKEKFDGKDNNPRKDPTDTLFVRPSIEKDRIKWVKKIFEWYANENISPLQIASRLNQLKVDPIMGPWESVRIRQLLSNPVYIGLPTWNKKGAARFVEYVDGKPQPVQHKKGGRKRKTTDYIQPDKPLFKSLIDKTIWNKCQRKAESAKSSVPFRSPKTAELWLRPFLICGHCKRPMHATTGRSTKRLWPSYFCSTYNKYGRNNPIGCRCHRVRHCVLEEIVIDYLQQTHPKVVELLKAVQTGDLKAIQPLMENVINVAGAYYGIECDIIDFIDDYATAADKKKAKTSDDLYGLIFERMRPTIEKQIADKEAQLDKMLDDFRTLSPKLRDRINNKMEALQEEIDNLKGQLHDLRQPSANLKKELAAREKSMEKAIKTLSKDVSGRQKTEALKGVIDRIICYFRHDKHKSYLERVDIIPVDRKTVVFESFINGTMPEPGSSQHGLAGARIPSWLWPARRDGCFP